MRKFLVLLTTTMTMIFGCNSNSNNGPAPEISVNDLLQKSESGVDFYLLDVRTMPELEERRLSFTDDLIPYDSLEFALDRLPEDKSSLIYCFCRSGRRSGIATSYLRSVGYENVYNVTGGIIAWQEAGFEIANGPFTKQ